MTITQVSSLLFIVSSSWGFVHDTHMKTLIRYPRTRSVFPRARHDADDNKLVDSFRRSLSSTAIFARAANRNQKVELVEFNSSCFDNEAQQRSAVEFSSPQVTGILPIDGNATNIVKWHAFKTKWESRFKELLEYKKQHGDCLVPRNFKENPQLGLWVMRQRTSYNSLPKMIPDERIQRLNEIGFEWDPLQAQWEAGFKDLLEYKQQHGDCLVPSDFQDNPQLGNWVRSQRRYYNSLPKIIPDARIQRLNEIGFEWDPLQAQWESRFKELAEYKRQYGDCLVPSEFQDNLPLGNWVRSQRRSYQCLPKTMPNEHIQRLNDIGFEWDAIQAQWESRFKELLEYKQQHGDCLVPRRFQENPQLGAWVIKQRMSYNSKPKTISDEHIQRLNAIGFEWDPLRSQWELRFKELVMYKQRYGDCLVPYLFQDNPQLGGWVHKQRSLFKREPKKISDERIQRLEAIGFERDVLKTLRESRF